MGASAPCRASGLQRVFTEVVERADRALGHAVRQVGEFETLLERQAFLVDNPQAAANFARTAGSLTRW